MPFQEGLIPGAGPYRCRFLLRCVSRCNLASFHPGWVPAILGKEPRQTGARREEGGFDKNWAGKNEEKDDGTNLYRRLFLGSLSGGRLGQVLKTAPLVRQVW